jgi:hypothetical protein
MHDGGAEDRADEDRGASVGMRVVVNRARLVDDVHRARGRTIHRSVVVHRAVLIVVHDRPVMNVMVSVLTMAMSVITMAAIRKRGGGYGKGGEQDGDLLGKHGRLLSRVECLCISRARAPQVNR